MHFIILVAAIVLGNIIARNLGRLVWNVLCLLAILYLVGSAGS